MPADAWTQFDCYALLDIPPEATPEQIRAAYRNASRRAHPDRGGSHEAQLRLNAAVAVLTDPVQRHAHDLFWQLSRTLPPAAPPPPEAVERLWNRAVYGAGRIADGSGATGFARLVRERIERDRQRLLADQESRRLALTQEYRQALNRARREAALLLLGLTVTAGASRSFPPLAAVAGALAWPLALRCYGVRIGERRVSALDPGADAVCRDGARRHAAATCVRDAACLDVHFAALDELERLALTPTGPGDPETQVVRRLSLAFFLLGCLPRAYDPDDGLLFVSYGADRLLVRLRHRSGPALGPAFVQKTARLCTRHKAQTAYLFSTPGLSARAIAAAEAAEIRWFDREGMNAWIPSLWRTAAGPPGDLLEHLIGLQPLLRALGDGR